MCEKKNSEALARQRSAMGVTKCNANERAHHVHARCNKVNRHKKSVKSLCMPTTHTNTNLKADCGISQFLIRAHTLITITLFYVYVQPRRLFFHR